MRPVNLIPSEERPGRRKPARGGPLAYIVVGALAAALLGVTLLVTTGNAISDSKAEISKLQGEVGAAKARAESLSSYVQFDQLHEERMATIASLANSRFDWERVMRELALILPGDVWLTSLDASASPEASAGTEGGGSLRTGVTGPALTLSGCATDQDAVAGFIQALKEIDGVTRVGMEQSSVEGGSASSGSVSGAGCEGEFVAQFQMVVAFDAAPVPSEAAPAEAAPATPPTEGATTSEPTAEASSESTEGEG